MREMIEISDQNSKSINIKGISRQFDPKAPKVLDNISLSLHSGKIHTILGPSGVGKTTLLEMIVEDLKANQSFSVGYLPQNGESANPINSNTIVSEYLFKDHPELKNNKELGIQKLREMSDLFHLEYMDTRTLGTLSGGEKKRIDIFKTLINLPQLVILDEPFNSLDPILMEQVENFLKEFVKLNQTTLLLTSHFSREALRFSDYIGILDKGKINQWDNPRRIYSKPMNKLIANYFSPSNLIVATLVNDFGQCEFGTFPISPIDNKIIASFDLKPENFFISSNGKFKGKVVKEIFLGTNKYIKVEHENRIYTILNSTHQLKLGDRVKFDVNLNQLHQTQDLYTEL